MKEELNAKMVEILTSIQTAAGKASDFALEQLPDIAQSYVLYGRVKSAAEFMVLISLSAVAAGVFWWSYKHPWVETWTHSYKKGMRADSNVFLIAVTPPLAVMFVTVAFGSFDYLVWFAPKVWLLKELSSLIK